MQKYCSVECKEASSSSHKSMCDKFQVYQSKPAPPPPSSSSDDAEYLQNLPHHALFSSAPAINILGLVDDDTWALGQINILLAASGDLGSLVKTIAEIPKDCQSHFNFRINDHDMNVVARNLVIILAAIHGSSLVPTAEAIVHFWYSSYLSDSVSQVLHDAVGATLDGIVERICSFEVDDNMVCGISQPWGTSNPSEPLKKLNLIFRKPSYLKLRGCIEQEEKGAKREMRETALDQHWKDTDQDMTRTKSRWRLDKLFYLSRGVLLPAGITSRDFRYLNPTFFRDRCLEQPRLPIDGWRLVDVLQVKSNVPSNDLTGKLFYYLRNMVAQFIGRLENLHVSFTLTQEDAGRISSTEWDYIDASNLRANVEKNEFEDILRVMSCGLSKRPGANIIERVRGSGFDESSIVQGARFGLELQQSIEIDNYTSSTIRHHGFRVVSWRRASALFSESDCEDDVAQHDISTEDWSIETTGGNNQPSESGSAQANSISIKLSTSVEEDTVDAKSTTPPEAKEQANTPSGVDVVSSPASPSSKIKKLAESLLKKTAKTRKKIEALKSPNLTSTPESNGDAHTDVAEVGVEKVSYQAKTNTCHLSLTKFPLESQVTLSSRHTSTTTSAMVTRRRPATRSVSRP